MSKPISLRDMPMISVEQKNKFREAALEMENERDALAAECETWSAMAVALANKHPVDSQTFDYMDELSKTDWGEALAHRDAIAAAKATRHAASLALSDAESESGEWRSAMISFAAQLGEVANMQEAMDNGDSE